MAALLASSPSTALSRTSAPAAAAAIAPSLDDYAYDTPSASTTPTANSPFNAVGGRPIPPALSGVVRLVSGSDSAAKAPRSAVDDLVGAACSFSGGTLVLMADGTKKPIGRIAEGDRVIATDPLTGQRSARKVTRTWVHEDRVVRLEVDGETIATTEDHPFWSQSDGAWTAANELERGDLVITAGGSAVSVEGFGPEKPASVLAYNLTVAGVHTYHVGRQEILVHNTCGDVIRGANFSISGTRKINQISARGWSSQIIDNTITAPYTTRTAINKATGGSATAYYRQSGAHVILDDATGSVIQLSSRKAPGSWNPDSSIVNPYKP